MSHLMQFVQQPVIHAIANALGWALLHFLWQGALIAGVLWCALQLLGEQSSRTRYAAACGALLLMLLAFSVTFAKLAATEYTQMRISELAGVHAELTLWVAAGDSAASWPERMTAAMDRCMPWILLGWFAGVLGFVARLNLGLIAARLLKSASTCAVSSELQQAFEGLRVCMGVARAVRLMHSARVQVPTVIGWLRPVVLIPMSCLSGISQTQLEAILCHELAHIRRHDYLVSVLQSAVEALLFYHPAVWWVSKQVRRERECCCDELAVRNGGDVLAYARALSFLEEQRGALPEVALAANGGVLKMRIKRLLGCSETPVTSQVASVAVLAILAISAVAIIGRYAYAEVKSDRATEPSARGAQQPQPPTAAPATFVGTDSTVTIGGTQQLVDEARQIELMESDLEKQIQNRENLARQVDEQARNLQAAMMMQEQVGNSSQLSADEQKRIAETKRQVREALDRLNSAEFRKQLDDAREQAARINSPEFRKQLEEARAKAQKVDSAEVRRQLDQAEAEMKRLNSPEFRKQLDEAFKSAQQNRELSQKLQEKLNSAEFKKQIAEAAAAASKVDSAQIRRNVDDAMKQMQVLQSRLATQNIARAEAPPAPGAETPGPSAPNSGAAAPNGPVRVSSGVMSKMVISQPPPVYPTVAKAAHVQGVVVLHARISKTGDVEDLRLVSGPNMLVSSAMEAVKQWKYKPFLLNGQPVEVDTTINVNYTFGGDSSSPNSAEPNSAEPRGPSAAVDGMPIRHIGDGVSVPELIYRVDPDYTRQARAAKLSGIVLVNLVVDQQGLPENVHVVRGVGSGLDEKAIDAVRQYRFKPAMLAGQAVPVDLNVEVNFKYF